MIYSKTCEYAVHTMIYLANQPKGETVTITHLSKELDISFSFLTKVLQQLTEKKFLHSFKGANGGVCLAKEPQEITLDDIIFAVSGQNAQELFAIGSNKKGEVIQRPLLNRWRPLQKVLGKFYRETTLANYREPITEKLFENVSEYIKQG